MDEATELYRIYETIWRNMDRENNLVNQRIMWSLTMTSGFLVAETFLLGRVFEIVSGAHAQTGTGVNALIIASFSACTILSGLATAVCNRVRIGVKAAFDQIARLEARYEELEPRFKSVLHVPRPFGDLVITPRGHSAATIFPMVMTGIWAGFAVAEFVAAFVYGRVF